MTTAQEARYKIQAILGVTIDGDFGPKTTAAFNRLALAQGSSPWPPQVVADAKPQNDEEPDWLAVARKELGVKEVPGPQDNSRILEYHRATDLKATDDEVSWCSSFANWALQKVGLKGTRNAMARSFLTYGEKLASPKPGCIVVFRRGAPPKGHVAFYLAHEGDRIKVIGGNQGDSVSVASYPASMVLGYRWPVE